jgi:hypothetical protein
MPVVARKITPVLFAFRGQVTMLDFRVTSQMLGLPLRHCTQNQPEMDLRVRRVPYAFSARSPRRPSP